MKVIELNNLCKELQEPLLTNLDFDFWTEYIEHHEVLDNWFVRKYKSMHYFCENDFLSKTDEVSDWLFTVGSLLFANQKKYHEWYRVQLIQDNDLSMTTNYDMHEETTHSGDITGATTSGQRTDVNQNSQGKQISENINKSTAFNTSNERVKLSDKTEVGGKNEINQFTQGEQMVTQHNTDTTTDTSYRYGNLGVMTGADILMSFKKALDSGVFSFYDRVFEDIAKELLIWGD